MKTLLVFCCVLVFGTLVIDAQPFANISEQPGLPELLLCLPPTTFFDPYDKKCVCDPLIECPIKFKVDPQTCTCVCVDGCPQNILCESPQIWNNKSCTCECPEKLFTKVCIGNSYWDINECRCRCKENQVNCCPPRVWNGYDLSAPPHALPKPCQCRCPNELLVSCLPPQVYDDVNCTCDCSPSSKKKCYSTPYHIWYPKPQCRCDCDQNQKPKCLSNPNYSWSPWPKCCNCKTALQIKCIINIYQLWKPFPQCKCECNEAKKSQCLSNWKYSWNPWPKCCDCKPQLREECQKIPYHGLSAFPKCDCVCDPAKKSECIANPNYGWDPSNSQCCDCNQENIEARIQECYNRPGSGWVWVNWPECGCLQTVGLP